MKIDLFYKSYAKDFKWLYYSLRSVKKFLTNYNEIVIVIPERDKSQFDYSYLPTKTTVHFVDERTKTFQEGYLYQQYIKMSAHLYCKGDYIMFCDSDLIFNTATDVSKLVTNNKPEILYTPYEKVGDAQCWREPTERFMNHPVEFEFMRRLPLIYHRSTVEKIFNLVPDLYNIIMLSGRFSEFNALGAWAFEHEQKKYSFINTDNWDFVPNYTEQFWSHSGLTDKDEERLKEILK